MAILCYLRDAYFHHRLSILSGGYYEGSHTYIRVGWPAGGGVWIWRTTNDEAGKKGGAKLQNAHTMEERCELIEQLGGVFYEDPTACPHLDPF